MSLDNQVVGAPTIVDIVAFDFDTVWDDRKLPHRQLKLEWKLEKEAKSLVIG